MSEVAHHVSSTERSNRCLEGHELDSRWRLGIFFEKDLGIYFYYLIAYVSEGNQSGSHDCSYPTSVNEIKVVFLPYLCNYVLVRLENEVGCTKVGNSFVTLHKSNLNMLGKIL